MYTKKESGAYGKLIALGLSLACLSSSVVYGKAFDAVYSVGDSITDAGAYRELITFLDVSFLALPPTTGRFTVNPGLTFSMELAAKFKLPNTPNLYNNTAYAPSVFLGGTNYAQGAAGVVANYDPLYPVQFAAKSMVDQVASLLSDTGGKINPNALVTVFGGVNDIQFGFPNLPSNAYVQNAAAVLGDLVQELKSAGAKHLLVVLATDLAQTPKAHASTSAVRAKLTELTNAFNETLLKGVKGTNAIVIDFNKVIVGLLNDPVRFGFASINHLTDYAALHANLGTIDQYKTAGGISLLVVQDEDLFVDGNQFIFADSVHPSPRTHQILADLAYSVLRAPGFMAAVPNAALANSLQFMHTIESNLYALQNLGCEEQLDCHTKFSVYTDYEFSDIKIKGKGLLLGPSSHNLSNGALVGGNYYFSPSVILGAAFNYQNTLGKVSGDRGHYRLNQYALALYTQGSFCCNWTGYAALSGGYLDGDSVRKDPIGIATARVDGDIRGQFWAGEAGVRYQIYKGQWISGPKLSYLYDYVRTNAFRETGDFTALKYGSMHTATSRINLGWDTEYGSSCDWARPFLQVGYDWHLGTDHFWMNYGMVTYSQVRVENVFSDSFNVNGGVKCKINHLFDVTVQGGFNWFWSNTYIGSLNVGIDAKW